MSVQQLDAYLSSHSYLGHRQCVTLLDYALCKDMQPFDPEVFPHLHRWHKHVSTLMARYPTCDVRGHALLPGQAPALEEALVEQAAEECSRTRGATEAPETTRASDLLVALGVSFDRFPVSKDDVRDGESITLSFARQCGLQDDRAMLKSMVYDVEKGGEAPPVFVVLPGHGKIDTKALAVAGGFNRNHIKPTKPERATGVTGYVFGGTTVLGSRIPLRTFVDKSVLELPRVYINGGSTKLVLALPPGDYLRALVDGDRKPEIVEVSKF